MNEGNLPRRSPINSVIDTWGFFLAAGLGIGAIVLLKELHQPQVAVTSAPVCIMFAYALVVYRSMRLRLREDQAGDNLYYLGLLYTLASLSHTLWSVKGGIKSEQVIADFGIALATTIVGLTLRIVFNQMRVDQNELEQHARASILESVEALRTELDQSVIELNSFRRSLQQSVDEAMTAATDIAKKGISKSAEHFDASTRNLMHGLEMAVAGIKSQADGISTAVTGVSQRVGDVSKKIEAIEVPSDLVRSPIERVVGDLTKASSDVASSMGRVTQKIDEMDVPVDLVKNLVVRAVGDISEASEAIKARIGLEEKVLKKLTKAAEVATGGLESWSAQVELHLAALTRAQEEMSQTLQSALEGSRAQAQILKAASDLEAAATHLSDRTAHKALADLQQELTSTVRVVSEHNSEMAKQLEFTRQNTSLVSKSLVDLSNDIVNKLNGDGREGTGPSNGAADAGL